MFSRIFINRPILACVISIVILFLGGLSIPMLPVEKTPDVTPPTVVVSATYPGADAQVIAECDRIEQEFGLPACDVIRHGPEKLVEAVQELKDSKR